MKRIFVVLLAAVVLFVPIAPAPVVAMGKGPSLADRVGFLEGWMQALETRVNRHNARLNGHDAELDALKPYVAGLTTRVGTAEHALGIQHEKRFALVAGFAKGWLDVKGNLVSCGELTKKMVKGLAAVVTDVNAGARIPSVSGYASTEPFLMKGKVHPDSDNLNLACAEMRARLVAVWLAKETGTVVTGRGHRYTEQFGVASRNRGVVVELVWDAPRASGEFTINPDQPPTLPPASNP